MTDEAPKPELVTGSKTAICGCVLTTFSSGRVHARACLACALAMAADGLAQASERIREIMLGKKVL